MNKKIYVVGRSRDYAVFLDNFTLTPQMESADLVMFTGGEDVAPYLYGEKTGIRTHFDKQRDIYEVGEFVKAKKLKLPMIGICRGAQFLCVMAGGKLVQHMKHPGMHSIYTTDGNFFQVNSLHHQMQYPYNMDEKKYEVLGYAEGLSDVYLDGNEEQMEMPKNREPEIVYYPEINALGIQSHPEMMYYKRQDHTRMYKFINDQIQNKLKIIY